MQKFTTPKGETLVVLALDEYERLIDETDIADAKAVRANIAAGRHELVPAEVVKRLIAGENPIRVWREHRGLNARELAQWPGISNTSPVGRDGTAD